MELFRFDLAALPPTPFQTLMSNGLAGKQRGIARHTPSSRLRGVMGSQTQECRNISYVSVVSTNELWAWF
jgi:hypothetical protein